MLNLRRGAMTLPPISLTSRAEVYGNARHILYGNCYVGNEEHEIQNFAFCEAMLQALIGSPGDTKTYDPIIGRYLDATVSTMKRT